MRKNRGFRLGNKLVKVFNWKISRRTHQRLNPENSATKVMSKICNWGRSLKHGAKLLCFPKSESVYVRVGRDPVQAKPLGVPKGHLAVYVGEKEDDAHRYLVPVIYFNHPLFGDLLREAEREFRFDHPGRIRIPCRVSEFENVRTRITAASDGGHRRRRWPVCSLRCLSGQ
ncbi:SAUR-like auxin-responsive protein family [Actinidia rufa]|uniref:SAUR-like auxin-responsive protein family n=1 Tax=Actinidia rufa TaxID=165716 RepID=A0A7J0G843_9ERIC|nr:SAUR-like auxin-responsive protein family [Actinidia rufa]